jgi:SAM-dependent methyltransferase
MTDAIELCLAGILSPEVALARATLRGMKPDEILARLEHDSGTAANDLRRLLYKTANLARLRAAAEAGVIDHSAAGSSAIGALRQGFDRLASISPEIGVAAYSLGDPDILATATVEVVNWLSENELIGPSHRVLDLGCGIGRIAAALAPSVEFVLGVDISPAMIAEARCRHGRLHQLRFELTDGFHLPRDPAGFDLILAVDSFPYLVQAGVARQHVAEAARLLRPEGALAIFNLSYQGLAHDRAAARAWSDAFKLQLTCDGVAPFRLWDAAVFVMRRAAD